MEFGAIAVRSRSPWPDCAGGGWGGQPRAMCGGHVCLRAWACSCLMVPATMLGLEMQAKARPASRP